MSFSRKGIKQTNRLGKTNLTKYGKIQIVGDQIIIPSVEMSENEILKRFYTKYNYRSDDGNNK